jgi:hypothetical protein
VAQHVKVIDAVRSRDHAGHNRRDLEMRVGADPRGHLQVLGDQAGQVAFLGQAHHRDQPGARHQIRVVELRADVLGAAQQSHLAGALSTWVRGASGTPIIPAQRAFALQRHDQRKS